MIKEALKRAAGMGIGVALGGCILPRLLYPHMYNNTYPPIWQQAILYFAVGYIVSFAVYLLIAWLKAKYRKYFL